MQLKKKKNDPLDVNAAWGSSAWDSAPSWNDDAPAAADTTAPAAGMLITYVAMCNGSLMLTLFLLFITP